MTKAKNNTEPVEKQKQYSIFIAGKTGKLGSQSEQDLLDEDLIEEPQAAADRIGELVDKGYLPVFPLNRAGVLDLVMEKGIDPNVPLLEGQKTVTGTIGRLHNPKKDRFLVVILDPAKEVKNLSPRFTAEKGTAFIGAVTPLRTVSKDNIAILDPETLEILWAPEGMVDLHEKKIIVNGAVKSLGNRLKTRELEESEYGSPEEAKRELIALLFGGYLPAFPFKKDRLEDVKKNGLDPSESNVKDFRGWRGSIGRQPYFTDYYAVIIDRNLAEDSLEPFFQKDEIFTGMVYTEKKIPSESIAIVDARTGEVVSGPKGVESEPVKSVRRGVSEKVKRAL